MTYTEKVNRFARENHYQRKLRRARVQEKINALLGDVGPGEKVTVTGSGACYSTPAGVIRG